MSKSGSGGRTDWKDKIDQSSWVDGTRWVESDDSIADPGVEFLESEPSAFRLSKPTEEVSESLLTSSTSRYLALGAVGVVLIALAIMSRPGSDEAAFEQLPTADQREILERRGLGEDNNDTLGTDPARDRDDLDETDDASASGGADGEAATNNGTEQEADSEPAPPPPIPRLRSDLPAELDGVLYITGTDGSLVAVDWAKGEATETPFPAEVTIDDAEIPVLQLNGVEVIMAAGDSLLQVTPAGLESSPADIAELLPTNGGLAVVAAGEGGQRMAFLVPVPGREPPESVIERTLTGDLDPVGRWNDQLVVQKAGKTWLLDVQGDGGRLLTDGQLMSFDGQHLVTFACNGPTECRIQVGTPDQPASVSVAVPENLVARDSSAWGPSATVSDDGRRLAIVDDTGAFSAPTVVDLTTEEVTVGTDIVNGNSPLMWSPDGRFLTYAFGDDLVLWDIDLDERYRIDIDRQIGRMLWASGPAGSDS